MPQFRTLPAELTLRLLKMERPILPDLAKEHDNACRGICGSCNGQMEPFMHPSCVFTPDDPLPRTVARCPDCGFVIDPKTKIVIDTGNPYRVSGTHPRSDE